MSTIQPFHLAIPVNNLEENRVFYRDTLGCEEGRSSEHWVDFVEDRSFSKEHPKEFVEV